MNAKRRIYELIIDQKSRWNCIPTQAQIRRLFSGTGEEADELLQQLESEGLITLSREGEISVAPGPTFIPAPKIKLRNDSPDNCSPHVTDNSPGYIALDLRGIGVSMPKNSLQAIHVSDDSMSDAGLMQGDIAFIDEAIPMRGDIVLVTVDGRNVLRRYITIIDIPHVIAENPRRPDLRAAFDLPMYGVFWGLIRTGPCRRSLDDLRAKVSYSTPKTCDDMAMGKETLPHRIYVPGSRAPVSTMLSKRGVKSKKPTGKKVLVVNGDKVFLPKDWPEPPFGNRLNDFPT